MNINIYSKYKLLITGHSSRLSEENETIYDNIFVIGSLDIIPKNLYNYFYLWIDLAANQNNIYYKLLE